ncbi:hypothetical protein INT45_010196, partial [Circinella minor]
RLPNTITNANDNDYSSIESSASASHNNNTHASPAANLNQAIATPSRFLEWADDLPDTPQQQINSPPPILLQRRQQQEPLEEPTLMERYSTEQFEHHQAMPAVLTDMMKAVDQLTARNKQQDAQIAQLLKLTERLHAAQQDLTNAKTQIQALEMENRELKKEKIQQKINDPNFTASTPTPLPTGSLSSQYATTPPPNDTQYTNLWHDRSSLHKIKKAAARAFTLPSETHGFCFKYFPTRGRKPVSEQRKNLRRLGIDNSRILDIHYPDTNVVGFLIHNDYEHELIEIMNKHDLFPNTHFDPHNPKYLRDQKLRDLPEEDQIIQADTLQYHRILRAIDFVRHPVKFAVARYFCHTQVITHDILQQVLDGNTVAPKRQPSQLSPETIRATANQFREPSPSTSAEMNIDDHEVVEQIHKHNSSGNTPSPIVT